MNFRAILHSRPMLLDAGMGTRLIARGLDLSRHDPSLWNLEAPEKVRSIHQLDHDAGSDALFTNTFGAHLATVPEAVAESINATAVRLAREAIGAGGFVIASLGPRNVWEQRDFRQIEILSASGVDALALETARPESALTALRAIRERTNLPVLVSLFARPESDFWREAEDAGAAALGINCIADFGLIRAILEDAARVVDLPLLVKPSAGLPGAEPAGPEMFANEVKGWLDRGARLIGGCCGTTDRHLRALRTAIGSETAGFRPDKIREIGL